MRQGDSSHKKDLTVEKEIVLSHSYISKRYDGIIEIYYSDITYDLEHFMEIDNHLKSLYDNEKLLILNLASHHTSITSKARSYLAENSRSEYIKAGAILIHSISQKILAHFFLHINKPKVISNYFSYKEKTAAEKWLMQFKNQG